MAMKNNTQKTGNIFNNFSLSVGERIDPVEVQYSTVIENLAKQESIITEFDRDSLQDGMVALSHLSKYGLDWILDVANIDNKSNYNRNWLACFDRIARYHQKNKNKKFVDGEVVSVVDDAIALVEYEASDYEKATGHLQEIETISQELQEIKKSNIEKSKKTRETQKVIKKLYTKLESMEIEGLRFAKRELSKKQKSRASFA